jgi:predicted Zn-dependent protease
LSVSRSYPASASHPSIPEGSAAGQAKLDRWRLTFESPDKNLEIPLSRLDIQVSSEENDESVFLADSTQRDWMIQVYDPAFLRENFLVQQAHTRHQLKAMANEGEMNRRLRVTLWFVVGFLLLAVLAAALTKLMVRGLVARIPLQWEQEIGAQVMAEVKTMFPMVQDPKVFARVDKSVAPLINALPASAVQYQFYVVQEDLPNAFALPGGHVVITTGLLDLAERPEQLAGVVAHEIAHVTERHGFRKIISAAGPYLMCQLFLSRSSGLFGMLGESSELLVRQSFSQEYELEADSVGWDYLVRANIDPRGMTEMLHKLELEQKSRQDGQKSFAAFSSHPATEKRIRKLEEKWKKLKVKSGFVELAAPAS